MDDYGSMNLSHDYSAILSEAAPDPLGELGRATTAYHDAPPDQIEQARVEYETALREFKSSEANN